MKNHEGLSLYRWKLTSGLALAYMNEDYAKKICATKATPNDEFKMQINRKKWGYYPNYIILTA